MDPIVVWPMITGAAIVVFGAGGLVEKIRNNKYLRKEVFYQFQKQADERQKRIDTNLQKMWDKLDKIPTQ